MASADATAAAAAAAAAAAPAAGAAKLACLCFTSPAAAAAPAAVVVRNKNQKYYSLARSPLRLPGRVGSMYSLATVRTLFWALRSEPIGTGVTEKVTKTFHSFLGSSSPVVAGVREPMEASCVGLTFVWW